MTGNTQRKHSSHCGQSFLQRGLSRGQPCPKPPSVTFNRLGWLALHGMLILCFETHSILAQEHKPSSNAAASGASMIPFYIGTYTAGSSQGIHRCLLDTDSGELTGLELVAEIDNPSFLTIHPQLDVLYACSEIRREGRRGGGAVDGLPDRRGGPHAPLGGQPSGGSGPCYVATDKLGKVALVANYGDWQYFLAPYRSQRRARRSSNQRATSGKGYRSTAPGGAARPLYHGRPQQSLCMRGRSRIEPSAGL